MRWSVGDGVVALFGGSLDTTAAPQALALDALVDADESLIVADFSAVDFVSSAGLRVLLATVKKIGSSGSLRICALTNP